MQIIIMAFFDLVGFKICGVLWSVPLSSPLQVAARSNPFLFVCLFVINPCLWFCRSMRCWTQMVQYPLDSELLLLSMCSTSTIVCSKQASKHDGYNSRKRHTKKCQHDSCLGHFYHKLRVNRYDRYHIHRYDSFVLASSTPLDPLPPHLPPKRKKCAPIPCIHNKN
jgi:hypothetical protein